MLLQRFTNFILLGRLQAMGVALVLAFVPLISILIAGLVTLRKGAFEGALVLIAASLPYVLGYAINPGDPKLAGAIGLILASNAITWVFAVILRRYGNWNVVLELSALVGIITVGFIHLLFPDVQTVLAVQLQNYLNKSMSMFADLQMGVSDKAQVNFLAQYATGFIIASVLSNGLLQLVIARWWQAAIFNPGGLQKELHQIHLSYALGIIFVIGGVLSYFGNSLVLDTMSILYLIFFAAGLSILHYYIALRQMGRMWLAIAYGVIVLLLPLSIGILAMVALIDSMVNFRKRGLR